MDPSKLLRASNDGKVEWNTTITYYPLHSAESATVILASDWLYFSRYGINVSYKCDTKIFLYMYLMPMNNKPEKVIKT